VDEVTLASHLVNSRRVDRCSKPNAAAQLPARRGCSALSQTRKIVRSVDPAGLQKMSQRPFGEQCQQASGRSSEGEHVAPSLAVCLSPQGMRGREELRIKPQGSEICGQECNVRQSVEDCKLPDALLPPPPLLLAPVHDLRSDERVELGSVNRNHHVNPNPHLFRKQKHGHSCSASALRKPSLASDIVECLDSGCKQGVLLHSCICGPHVHLTPWCYCEAVMMFLEWFNSCSSSWHGPHH
jgi:hypothetical protein